jgi:hypothetical protein
MAHLLPVQRQDPAIRIFKFVHSRKTQTDVTSQILTDGAFPEMNHPAANHGTVLLA